MSETIEKDRSASTRNDIGCAQTKDPAARRILWRSANREKHRAQDEAWEAWTGGT